MILTRMKKIKKHVSLCLWRSSRLISELSRVKPDLLLCSGVTALGISDVKWGTCGTVSGSQYFVKKGKKVSKIWWGCSRFSNDFFFYMIQI